MPTSCSKNLQVTNLFSQKIQAFLKLKSGNELFEKDLKGQGPEITYSALPATYSIKNGIIILFCYTKLISTFTTCYKVHGGLKKDSNEITRILSSK